MGIGEKLQKLQQMHALHCRVKTPAGRETERSGIDRVARLFSGALVKPAVRPAVGGETPLEEHRYSGK